MRKWHEMNNCDGSGGQRTRSHEAEIGHDWEIYSTEWVENDASARSRVTLIFDLLHVGCCDAMGIYRNMFLLLVRIRRRPSSWDISSNRFS